MINLYKPPYTITPSVVYWLASIMELVGKIKIQNELSLWVPEQRHQFRLQSIHATLAIENNPLSFQEVSRLMESNLSFPKRVEIEVMNAKRMYEVLSEFDVLKESDLLKAHNILMSDLVQDAGQYRKADVGVYQGNTVIFMAPPHKRVPELMGQLFEYLLSNEDHFLIQSSVFHYEFEFIHPFSDGNGRIGRFWQKVLLNKHQSVFGFLPLEHFDLSSPRRVLSGDIGFSYCR
jgi:Fic family protein